MARATYPLSYKQIFLTMPINRVTDRLIHSYRMQEYLVTKTSDPFAMQRYLQEKNLARYISEKVLGGLK